MYRRVFVPRETSKTNLALFFCFIQRFDHTTLCKMQVRVVLVDDLVNLPQVQMVGAQSLKGLLQLLHGDVLIPAMRANLAHQENFIAPSL